MAERCPSCTCGTCDEHGHCLDHCDPSPDPERLALEAVARAADAALEAWGSGTFDDESAAMETLMHEIEALREARRG